MSRIGDILLALSKQLYPTGRAFKMPDGGYLEGLHTALAVSEKTAYDDAVNTLYTILPDNLNFTADDASDWERRLGMIDGTGVPLADRKAAILRKLQAPGVNPAKGHYLFVQQQLQAAGFTDVYVYENRFADYPDGYITKTPDQFSIPAYPSVDQQHSSLIQHGDIQHGETYANKVANNISQSMDDPFDLGSDLRSTFFIGGSTEGSWADVSLLRKDEFRQLILKLKPTQEVAFLLINYI